MYYIIIIIFLIIYFVYEITCKHVEVFLTLRDKILDVHQFVIFMNSLFIVE